MDTSTKMSICSSSYLDNIVSSNESFDKGFMYIAYKGNNRNGSYISKEDFEKCAKTLAYVPVVANYKIDKDKIGSHDSEFITNKYGEAKEIVLTNPLGLVPEQPHWCWKTIQEDTGQINEYFCCEILLWKRQPVYEHIKANKITDQSMEISVHEYEMIDGVCHIKDFTFTALALLESAEPCFESASLHMFSNQNFREQMNKMFDDFKTMYSNVNTDNKKNHKKEDNKLTKQFHELIKSYGFDPDSLELDFSEMTLELLTSKLEKMKADKKTQEFLLSSNFREALYEAISTEKIETEYGNYNRYSIVDYDTEQFEVYAYDLEDYKLYGFVYSVSGDTVTIDFSCKKKKKYAIVDFVEGDLEYSLEEFAKSIATSASDKATHELTNKFSNDKKKLEQTIAKLKEKYSDYDVLKSFKETTIYEKERKEKEDILNEFIDTLSDIDEFEQLNKDIDKYTVTQLSEKCDAIYGKAVRSGSVEFKLETNTKKHFKLPIGGKAETKKPYDGLFEELEVDNKVI